MTLPTSPFYGASPIIKVQHKSVCKGLRHQLGLCLEAFAQCYACESRPADVRDMCLSNGIRIKVILNGLQVFTKSKQTVMSLVLYS